MKKPEKSYAGWCFLVVVVMAYIAIGFFEQSKILESLSFAFGVVKKIVPIFALIFVLMALINYYTTPKMVSKYLGKKAGLKGWVLSVTAGIVSTGPIYAWYPLLNEIKSQGGIDRYIATFLYSRAIKPALLPLMIFYFGVGYTLILAIVMIVVSILQGIIVEKLVELKRGV